MSATGRTSTGSPQAAGTPGRPSPADAAAARGITTTGPHLAAGDYAYGQCNVGDWTDIVQVAAGTCHTVGLKSDGTAVAVGDNASGQCNVRGWTDITQIHAGTYHTVGLKSDGTVVA